MMIIKIKGIICEKNRIAEIIMYPIEILKWNKSYCVNFVLFASIVIITILLCCHWLGKTYQCNLLNRNICAFLFVLKNHKYNEMDVLVIACITNAVCRSLWQNKLH